jgi:steroid 5-alpha reductase family enzyme
MAICGIFYVETTKDGKSCKKEGEVDEVKEKSPVVGYVILAGIVSVWVAALVFAIRAKKEWLDKATTYVRYSNLYDGVDTSRRWSMALTSFFFLRRILFVLILV